MSKITPHYRENRTVLADVIPLETPFSLQCEVSQVCNLRCGYCMQSFVPDHPKNLMTMDLFVELCNQMAAFGEKFRQVNFAGWGEPLMNNNLPAMIGLLKARGVTENIAIVTNGLLLSPGLSLSLIAEGVDHIRISLQGLTSMDYINTCDRWINFDRLIEDISFLYKNKKQCQVSVKIANVALEKGHDEIFYSMFSKISDRMYIEHIRPMFPENQQDGKIVSKFGIEHKPVIVCPQPFFMMAVTATGDVIPCCSYSDPMGLGNIRLGNPGQKTLKSIWNGRRLLNFNRDMLHENRHNQTYYDVCQSCLMPDAITLPEDNLDEKANEIGGRL